MVLDVFNLSPLLAPFNHGPDEVLFLGSCQAAEIHCSVPENEGAIVGLGRLISTLQEAKPTVNK